MEKPHGEFGWGGTVTFPPLLSFFSVISSHLCLFLIPCVRVHVWYHGRHGALFICWCGALLWVPPLPHSSACLHSLLAVPLPSAFFPTWPKLNTSSRLVGEPRKLSSSTLPSFHIDPGVILTRAKLTPAPPCLFLLP